MLKKKMRERLTENFNRANDYQGKPNLVVEEIYGGDECIPRFNKFKYKKNCILTMSVAFAMLLIVTIISASFVIRENMIKNQTAYNQYTLTAEEVEMMDEKCDRTQTKPLYYVNLDGKTFVTIFTGSDESNDYYYLKLDIEEYNVIVNIGEEEITLNEDGFYFIGSVENNSDVDSLFITITDGQFSRTYEYKI